MTEEEQRAAWREGLVMSLGQTIRLMARDPLMMEVSGTHALILVAQAIEKSLQANVSGSAP